MKRSHVAQLRSFSTKAVIGISLITVLIAVPLAASGGSRHAEGNEHHTVDDRPRRQLRLVDLTRALFPIGIESLDGSGNNLLNPDWGQANQIYSRVAGVRFADGVGVMVGGPSPRYVSNRVFNDIAQNVFSENKVTQWVFAWGQFLDHNFGLRQDGTEDQPIVFDPNDPLEQFTNDLGAIDFTRSAAAAGTGVNAPRQQVNTVSSYIDAWAVYGGSTDRLEWLRVGPVDGNMSNNQALLLSEDGYLPTADARGELASAPGMQLPGRLMATPEAAVVAGDVRANENIALTAIHTLFLREHNRIVESLPDRLPEELKFKIARRIVIAEIQYITYHEFLPALGIELDAYHGYDPTVNATLSNEFAVVGYRAHSMIHGEFDLPAEVANYTDEQLADLEALGVEVVTSQDQMGFTVPLNVAFGAPNLVEAIGLDPIMAGLGAEIQYRNDEMIDNQLRSVLFQIPGPGVEDPSVCLDGPPLPDCFSTVLDLGAVDIQRARDHGIPSYNDLRIAFGLSPVESFTALTGEGTDKFPNDPAIGSDPIDDPSILGFVELTDAAGNPVEPFLAEAEDPAVTAVRRTTLAARLKAIYGDVSDLDAFVGMLAEPHIPGTEMGELQAAIWRKQFEALRDGDRYFYLNDPSLTRIRHKYGITYRHTLAEIISLNTELSPEELSANVFTG